MMMKKAKIVPEYCPQLDEEAISDRAFDVSFACASPFVSLSVLFKNVVAYVC